MSDLYQKSTINQIVRLSDRVQELTLRAEAAEAALALAYQYLLWRTSTYNHEGGPDMAERQAIAALEACRDIGITPRAALAPREER